MHTKVLPNNQLSDDHSDESSNNQLTNNQQPDMTTNHTSKVDDNVSNKLETMPNKVPLKGDRICYKNTDSQWINAFILRRAGKSTGKYKHWYNVRNNDLFESSVNLDAIHWKPLPPNTTKFANAINITENQNDNDFINAKYDETEKFKRFNAYEEVPDSGRTCVSTTWVFNCKEDKVRPRLVARGYEENTDTRTDSATIMKSSFRTFLTIASSQQWTIKTTDIKSAFLQGAPISRDIFIKPPAESTTPPGMIWKLRRCLYGLNDAARQFYEFVHTTLLKLGCRQSSIDPAFYHCIRNNKTNGLFACHVHDFLHAVAESFELNIYNNLITHFQPGKSEHSNFKYIGFTVNQTTTSTIDQKILQLFACEIRKFLRK